MSDLAPTLITILAALAGGGLGALHFLTLRRVSDMLLNGRLVAVGLQLARLAVMALFLWLCARAGAAPLLAGAAGVLAGRAIVLRRVR
ncbi:ATP synthase subunit I [Gemmobacter nectariphilus]|uniref:N-ATPase subunit AtpR n=1 Tax=Gemmobacter nectariphilus TaxID=220343 RepID=UPI00041D22F7|nr:ATP synthase subunit I [Gemmobacter nectariphilus]